MPGMKAVTQVSQGRWARASAAWLSSTQLSHVRPAVDLTQHRSPGIGCPEVSNYGRGNGRFPRLTTPRSIQLWCRQLWKRGHNIYRLEGPGEAVPQGGPQFPQGSSVPFLALQRTDMCRFPGLSPESMVSPGEPAVEETVPVGLSSPPEANHGRGL